MASQSSRWSRMISYAVLRGRKPPEATASEWREIRAYLAVWRRLR